MSRFFCYACQCDKPESSKVYVSKAVVRCRACVDAAAEFRRTGVYNGFSPYAANKPSEQYIQMEVEGRVDACILDSYRESVLD